MYHHQLPLMLLAGLQLVQLTAGQSREQLVKQSSQNTLDLCSNETSGCECVQRDVICDCHSANASMTELKIGGTGGLALPERAQSLIIENCRSVFLQEQETVPSENGRYPALTSLQIINCKSVQMAPKSIISLARLTDIKLTGIQKLDLTADSLQLHQWTFIQLNMVDISTDQIPSDVFGEDALSLESLTINNSRIKNECNLNIASIDKLSLNNSTMDSLKVNIDDSLHVTITNCNMTRLEALKTNANRYSAVSFSTQQFEGNFVGIMNTGGVSTVAGMFTFNDNIIKRMEGSQGMDVTFRSATLENNRLEEISGNLFDHFYQMNNIDLRWSHKKQHPTNHSSEIGVTFVGNTIGSTGENPPDIGQMFTAVHDSIHDYTVKENVFICDQCELIQSLVIAAKLNSDSANVSDGNSVNMSDINIVSGSDDVSEKASDSDKYVSSKEVYAELYRTSVCQWSAKYDGQNAGKKITLKQFAQEQMDSSQKCIKKHLKPESTNSGTENTASGTSDRRVCLTHWLTLLATTVVTAAAHI